MAVPVEEAIAALSTFSLEDDQPDVQGMTILLSTERCATTSPIEYCDVHAYRLSLVEDTQAVKHLNTLVQEGREMSSVLYTYRSCVKALPQLPESMKQSQADLYLETYQVLDMEMSRLREVQQWQGSAASKLAADIQQFSRPECSIVGPTVTHLWSMIKLIDVLMGLDHLKNAKSSIPNDFSWYKRTFSQVSGHWSDTDSIREELDDLQIFLSTRWAILLNLHVEMSRVNHVEDILQVLVVFCVETLELDPMLLCHDRYMLLRVLPVLVVLATLYEKDSGSLYKRVKIGRLISIFKNCPVIPAFPDLHLSPAAIVKELSNYFPKISDQTHFMSLLSPHEIPLHESQEYQNRYLIINRIEKIRAEHDDFAVRFASAMNQIMSLKSTECPDIKFCKVAKRNMYEMVVDGFKLLSTWTGYAWEQCAWKFSHPCKDVLSADAHGTSDIFSDYEKVVRWNYTADDQKAMVELVSYIKCIGSMMHRCDSLLAETLYESIHGEVQDFVQNKLAAMMHTPFWKKKDRFRILSDMRTLSADWMANMAKPEPEFTSMPHGSEEAMPNSYPRLTGLTATQVHCLQFLILELVAGGGLKKEGYFSINCSEVPAVDVKQLEIFFYKLKLFLHILDYTATITSLTDLSFLWFRELFLETSRVIQFPIECSLPWILVDHVLESEDGGLLESVLMPFDIYNDSAQHALTIFKQRFLYDEIEAEADLCFDQFLFKLSVKIFTHFKSIAASKLLDSSFLSASDPISVHLVRYNAIMSLRRFQLLGRNIDLKGLLSQWMNKLFRDNIDFLFDWFESLDLCAVVELQQLLEVLKLTHHLLSEYLTFDPFHLMLNEMQESTSLISFTSRLASQIWATMHNDFLPYYLLCNTTQRFVPSPSVAHHHDQKSAVYASSIFCCGSQELNEAYHRVGQLYRGFIGVSHVLAIYTLLGSRSIPWLFRALLDHASLKLAALAPKITRFQEVLPKSFALLPYEGGIAGGQKFLDGLFDWGLKVDLRTDMLRDLRELGNLLYFIALLDTVIREVGTTHYMQIAPWLGLVPGSDEAMQQHHDSKDSPLNYLFKSDTFASVLGPQNKYQSSFAMMSKQAEAADLLYRKTLQSGNMLEYTLAFMNAALHRYRSNWSPIPKTGLIDITSSKYFYRVFSCLQYGYLLEASQGPSNNFELLGDSIAWGGCTIIYLLGQKQQFELFDFSYQLLNVAEADDAMNMQHGSFVVSKNASHLQEWENLLEAMKKARRLNSHVFSMLKARCPLEDKVACGLKQSGVLLNRIQYENTPSSFETLPQRGA